MKTLDVEKLFTSYGNAHIVSEFLSQLRLEHRSAEFNELLQ